MDISHPSRRFTVAAFAAMAAVVLACFVFAPTARAATGDFIISGRGYGHGEGMSQWGMWEGSREGNTYKQILSFYYPGTALTNLSVIAPGRQNIVVRITTSVDYFDSVQLTAMATPATLAGSTNGSKSTIKTLAVGEPVTLVYSAGKVQVSGAATAYDYVDLTPVSADGRVKVAPSVLWSSGTPRQYWGYIRIIPNSTQAKLYIHNFVPIDKYVAGVSEIAPDWAVPGGSTFAPDAVKAQDVAARTYIAAHSISSVPYDDSRDMNYVGYNVEAVYPYLSQAAQETSGEVLTYYGGMIQTNFSSSSGGYTTDSAWSSQVAYQPAQYDRWSLLAPSSNPGYAWTVVISPADMAAKLADHANVGTITAVDVVERDTADPQSHARTVKLTGTTGTATISAHIFESHVGCRSTLILSVVKDEGLTLYQQADPALVYAGAWVVQADAGASGGSFRYADTTGSSCTVTFNGTYLAWLAKKSVHYGQAKVTLDGVDRGLVDLYNATEKFVTVWETGTLAAGTHTLKIEWTGKKNPLADDYNISVDAFKVAGVLTQPSQAVLYQQTDSHLLHKGAWKQQASTSASGGSYEYVDASGSSCTVSFDGTYFSWLAKKSPLYGKARVIVDGRAVAIIDLYSPTAVYGPVWSRTFAPGTHTVTISWTGDKNAAATAANISVDAFKVNGTLLPAPTGVRYQQDATGLVYSGTWATFSTAGASGGSYKRANTSGASVTISFKGTYLCWIATKGVTLGKAWVSLDGKKAVSVDLAWTEVQYQQPVWNTGLLSLAPHTVKIWWDTANPLGKYISVDAVEVVGTLY